ncbi:hypothetical protein BHE74_00057267 [Ensete ventricosum]|uniref:Uncharacterized protein n=1 Tax=Ensete ventricosum TaxID=4639 RepID=A0A426XXE7_ENSVE|nr:hypothetical protein B296_00028633 [Ensete ventricosum]RWW32443.1 hypothetical protein GW17_00002885 [Ensete ventricosum]RWW37599.1 hypothetical protein BHE74_00057267 [Ensete ventricosum]RZS04422.1 hypothetical protein BHM03_00034762 [Ensete ventricosum]
MSSSVAYLTSWSLTPMTHVAPPRTSGSFAGARRVPTTRGASSSGGGISLNCLVRWRLGRRPSWISGLKATAVVEPVGRGWRSVTSRAVLASDMGAEEEVGHSRCFLRVRNEEGANWFAQVGMLRHPYYAFVMVGLHDSISFPKPD